MAHEQAGPTSVGGASLVRRGADYFKMSGEIEFIAAASLFVLMVLVRVINITRYRFDSDEAQHLHVIWGWTRGLVQYRDLFDNHMPLFHILLAPIFGLIGERPTVLYWMRFILLPMYFVAAWCTYRIAAVIFSRRVGVWSVILVGLFFRYHFISLEFRTDNVWAPLWLLCMTVLVSGSFSVSRMLVAGVFLGLCFAVSPKSVLFLISLGIAAPLSLFLVHGRKVRATWGHVCGCAAFLAATFVIPATIITFFGLKGVGQEFRSCVLDHNALAARVYHSEGILRHTPLVVALIVIAVCGVVFYAARILTREIDDAGLAYRRGLVLFVCVAYFLLLKSGIWPLIGHDDFPPFYPLAFILFCGAVIHLSDRLRHCDLNILRTLGFGALPIILAVAEIFLLVAKRPFWQDRARREANLLRDVLALTDRHNYVLDCKGETVFRRRCFRPVFETITRRSIERGLIADDAPQRCIETRTCVVATMLMKRFSRGTRQFVKRNYLPVTDSLRVAGVRLKNSAGLRRFDFEIVIPASYQIISNRNPVSGTLDGTPFDGGRFLAAGPHTFESASATDDLIALWTQAVDRHFTPFNKSQSGQ